MYSHVSHSTFNLERKVNHLLGIRIFFVQFFKIRFYLESLIDCHRESLASHRYEFCNTISRCIGVSESTRNVAHRSTRHHGSEGTDLCNVVGAVFCPCIVNNFVTTVVGVVHVDIRCRGTFRIEESFKGEIVFEGIYIRNPEDVRGKRPSNRPANCRKNFSFTCFTQKVAHHKEVFRIPLHFDNAEFVLETFLHNRIIERKSTPRHTGVRGYFEFIIRFATTFDFVVREVPGLSGGHFHRTHGCDFDGIFECFFFFLSNKKFFCFFLGDKRKVRCKFTMCILCFYNATRLDFDHCLARKIILFVQIVHVMLRYEFRLCFFCKCHNFFLQFLMPVNFLMMCNLKIAVVTENTFVPVER